mmetsp:Transcript_6138/g.19552  ORF Transcript_6138/g.19552 Transcript_6138/m.19552 type:complete len:210 (-) Transcript_6138:79-708(-)
MRTVSESPATTSCVGRDGLSAMRLMPSSVPASCMHRVNCCCGWLSRMSIWWMIPSSPPVRNTEGEVGSSAMLWARPRCCASDLVTPFSRSSRLTSPSAALDTIRVSFVLGREYAQKMLPVCGVRSVWTRRRLSASHIMILVSSDPVSRYFPVSEKRTVFTQPAWPYSTPIIRMRWHTLGEPPNASAKVAPSPPCCRSASPCSKECGFRA